MSILGLMFILGVLLGGWCMAFIVQRTLNSGEALPMVVQ